MGRGFSILGNIKAEQRVEKFRLKKFKLANLRTNLLDRRTPLKGDDSDWQYLFN